MTLYIAATVWVAWMAFALWLIVTGRREAGNKEQGK